MIYTIVYDKVSNIICVCIFLIVCTYVFVDVVVVKGW